MLQSQYRNIPYFGHIFDFALISTKTLWINLIFFIGLKVALTLG